MGVTNNMKLGIFGSRTLGGKRIKDIIRAEYEKYRPEYIVTSGGIRGVCTEVEIFCKRNGNPVKLYYANRVRDGRGMYDIRSKSIIRESDHIVLIHDGKSRGTKHELELVKKLEKPFTYHLVKIIPILEPDSLGVLSVIEVEEALIGQGD